MAEADDSIARALSPFLRIHKDGRVERLMGTDRVPPSMDPASPVLSKDVVVSPEPAISVRLYLPNSPSPSSPKLPVLVYFHGGGFVIETTESPTYHNYLSALAAEARVVVVSVEYRRAPEHPLPAAYDDSWAAIKWVGAHSSGQGHEGWLNDHADLTRVYFGGDSAGANIAHHMGLRFGEIESSNGTGIGIDLAGLILVHPYFWGDDPLPEEATEPERRALLEGLWRLANPTATGCDDPHINPAKDPGLLKMGCSRVLVCVAEEDPGRQRGWHYKEVMEKCGWKGEVEVTEAKGEGHVFHLMNPASENSVAMMKRLVKFMNNQ
ncbi:probable carboxylesterase 12 [Punica granatum]|uniref:Alpha/beta hydrolase fold-3 domain-containing protein n=2 Tax=Punica granatum TaxID=22663 RepID=A0A218XGZ9_PUNGR|nr:probable carboxylesterase 12 [Punica granatum]OWM83741.1 hypothetical protein CDL15_Pgr004171 [Punica granatum]PKI55569.1 hypothetical protein CRG98_024069 [Punica granatum]